MGKRHRQGGGQTGAGTQHGGRTDHRTKLMEVTKYGDNDDNDYQLTMPIAQVLYIGFILNMIIHCELLIIGIL